MAGLTISDERALWLAIHESIREVSTLLGTQDQNKGGCFRLFLFKEPYRGHIDLAQAYMRPWVGGEANRANADKYFVYSFEKAIRVAQEYAARGHISSAQSADPANEKWDGASIIQCNIPDLGGKVFVIPSVSGWPAKADATIGLRAIQQMAAWKPGPKSLRVVVEVAENEIAQKVLGL